MVLQSLWESRSPPSFKKPRYGLYRGFFCIFALNMSLPLFVISLFLSLSQSSFGTNRMDGWNNHAIYSSINLAEQDTLRGKRLESKSLLPSITPPDSTVLQLQDSSGVEKPGVKGTFRDKIDARSILEILSVPSSNKIFSWKLNKNFLEYEKVEVDTALWLNHYFYPQQKKFESFTFLGNLGSPSNPDHFFSRSDDDAFLLGRYYSDYRNDVREIAQYNVRSPFTKLFYTSAGKRSEAEQVFSVLHTQNVNKHINIGITYNHWGTKGVYQHQETRNNLISLFGSYHKGNVFGQFSFANRVFNNKENGGIDDFSLVADSIETKLIPVWLSGAKSVSREQSIFAMFGYTLLNIKELTRDTAKTESYIPLINTKLLVSREHHSRMFSNTSFSSGYFDNFFISNTSTYDTISQIKWDVKAVFEINQFANIPGMPGLRGWLGYEHTNYFMFRPEDYIYAKENDRMQSAHIGVAAFSDSPFFSYRGAAKAYFTGDKADDKELKGEVRLSLWRDADMPQLKGKIEITETTPNIFYRTFFSNHFRWENNLHKEKRFSLGSSLEIPKWSAEVGYNVMHIRDYIYFNEQAVPAQTSNVTVTSAYGQINLKFWKKFNFFNRVVWQANTNTDVLSLPNIIAYSALFYESVLVPGALSGQFGVNVVFRSRFFADAYNPATAQFYNQRVIEYGDYPIVDVFANLKWKRAIIFLKYEHLNQGYPNNRSLSAFSYPINPQVFKFGVSWIFYD